MMVTLVMGAPGTGKSTWVRERLGDNGLAYDLDAIAGAFRLRGPHEEYCPAARVMADDLLPGWLRAVAEYADDVYVIRTAPTWQELEGIQPDRAVVCMTRYTRHGVGDAMTVARRRADAETWLKARGIPIEYACPPPIC